MKIDTHVHCTILQFPSVRQSMNRLYISLILVCYRQSWLIFITDDKNRSLIMQEPMHIVE